MRFPNFDNSWKLLKLRNCCKFFSGGTPLSSNKELYKGKIPFIRSGEINLNKTELFINEEALKCSSAKMVHVGDLLLALYGATSGEIGISKITGAINQAILCIRTNQNNKFLKYQWQKNKNRILKTYLQGGQGNLSGEIVSSLSFNFPELEEQDKIVKFLNKIDTRIETQNKIIEHYESLIKSLRNEILYKNDWKWIKLKKIVDKKSIELQRGNIIPKHNYDSNFIYPVYSSSIHNNGLMGFNDSYMFNDELITWSIDGGGNFFLRNKHKFNVTNVCGILKILDNSFDYSFLFEILSYQHSKMTFDYQTKAHPSVIQTIYSIPLLDLKEQKRIGSIFKPLYDRIKIEKEIIDLLKVQKEYLLRNLFI